MVRQGIRGRRRTAPDPQPPITRREYAKRWALSLGMTDEGADRYVSTVEGACPEWNMDQMVDPDTGEPIPTAPAEQTGG